MSRIRRLSIRGIRNFGDEKEEVQIRFSRPLTLIFGPNGTGKTTIIEALKFVTCGEFPPGSERGKFFVHDPLLAKNRTKQVMGVIKAEIIDPEGHEYTISRTISCKQTNAALKFRTLDNTFTRKSNTGEALAITNRCIDVDAEMKLMMKVSKPILEYVIFCHQEELNWPFLEGKKLKERFDEIFDTTMYNKALEHVSKIMKDMNLKVKLLMEKKKHCTLMVEEVKSKEKNLEEHKKRLEHCNSKIEDIDKKLEPLNNDMEKLSELTTRYKNLQAEEQILKTEYDIYKKQLEKLKGEIRGYIFEGSAEELQEQINLYNNTMQMKNYEVEKADKKLKDIHGKEKEITNTLLNEKVNINFAKQQMEEQEATIALRNQMLNEALSAWNLDDAGSNISESELSILYKKLEGKLREFNSRLKEKKVQREEQEKKLQKVVDCLRSEYSRLDSEKNLKEIEIAETIQESNEIKLELEKFVQATQKLNIIEEKIKRMQMEIDRLNEVMDVDAEKMKLSEKIKIQSETELLLNKVDEEITLLLKLSPLEAELELSKSNLRDKKKELERLRNKHEDNMKTLFDMREILEIKLKSNLDTVQRELMQQIECIDRDIEAQVHRATTLEATVAHMKREIENKQVEINSKKNEVALICDYKQFDKTLLLQSKKVKDLQDERGMYAHRSVAFKEYKKKLKEPKPCCPLCHRDFSEVEDVEKLLKEMESEEENHPNRLREYDEKLKVQQKKYDKMLQLKPVVESIIQFENVELEKLTNNLAESENQLTESQTYVKYLKTMKVEPEKKLTMCKNIIGDIMLWDKYIDEISKLKNMVDNYHARIAAVGVKTKRGLKETQAEREELKASLKHLRDEIEKLQSSINVHVEEVNNARQKHNALHEEQLKIRAGEEKTKELRQKQNDLHMKEIRIRKSLDILKEKVIEAKSKLNSAIDELEAEKKKNLKQQEIDGQRQARESTRLSELRKVQDKIDDLLRHEYPKLLMSSESKIEECQKLLTDLSVEKRDLETTISDLKEESARHEVRKRELLDNFKYKKIEKTLENSRQKYLSVQEKIKSINYSELQEDYKILQIRVQSLLQNKDKLKGNKEELARNIEQYTQELKRETYRLARQKFNKVTCELWSASNIVVTLEQYNKLLDNVMIKHHETCMIKINQIMKKLWQIVYTGKDTTSVQIRMECTQGVGGRRRTYNYKLVQMKHNHEIEMKGRCSAGQKVLTSIIIRIALAETFCKQCGILALDEPTTNLDESNATSLGIALNMLVKLRSQHQKNFQLLVISHDANFLMHLAQLSTIKGYYELYRKPDGFSSIRYRSVEEKLKLLKEGQSTEKERNNVDGADKSQPNAEPLLEPESSSDKESDDLPTVKDTVITSEPSEIPVKPPSNKKKRPIRKRVDDDDDCAIVAVTKKFALG